MNEERKNQQAAAEPSLSEILQVRRDKLKALQDAGRDPFVQTRFERSAYSVDIKNDFDAYEGKTLQAAGRIMSKRGMGKAIFCDIQDDRGQIQLYARKDAVTEQEFADFRKYDIGDIIGVRGYAFKTKTGEISIHVQQITLLSKSLRPLPEKFHGMTNTELRYRQRYVDLIMNPESKRNFQIRSRFVAYLRRYLDGLGFMEVETPVLSPIAGGATARPFITHHNALDIDQYLRIASELYLKKLIVGGFDGVYEFGKDFRNEGMDRTHNPEFTVLEVYEAYGDRTSMKAIIEGLLPHLCEKVLGRLTVEYGEAKEILDFTPPYREIAYKDAVKEMMGQDWFDLTVQQARAKAEAQGLEIDPAWDHLLITHEVYDKLVEKTLRQPTFVTRVPRQFVPLAKACADDPELVDVFEFVVAGKELCPGYTEQNDPEAQRKAFADQVGEDTEKIDEDFITALEHGMPPTGGLGMGIDRLVMMLTGTEVIRDVILFPQLKKLQTPSRQ